MFRHVTRRKTARGRRKFSRFTRKPGGVVKRTSVFRPG